MKHLIKHFLCFAKKVFTNKIAILFAMAHSALITLALVDTYTKEGTLLNITKYINDQTLLVTVLMVINMPVIFLSLFVSVPLGLIFGSLINESVGLVILFAVILLCINFQWALIGYGIDKLVKFFQPKAR